jgi:polysaccharide biosynthesis transport protein
LNLPITKLSHQARQEEISENCLPSDIRTEIFYLVRRHAWIVAAAVFLTLSAGVIYILTAPKLYTAHTSMLLDPRNPKPVVEPEKITRSLDNPEIESQITILKSDQLHAAVVDSLKLYSDPEFVPVPVSEPYADKKQGPAPPPDPADVREAIDFLQSRLEVKRVNLSYILAISFRSEDPERAAQVTNAIADLYLQEQLTMHSQIASQGSKWLEARIDRLRQQVNEAVLKVQEFRAKRRSKEGNQTTLDALESTATTYRKLYESYLQAYTDSVQRQALPPAMARIVTRATAPMSPSHPRKAVILVVSVLLGLLAGFGIAVLRNFLDQSVRGHQQIEQAGIHYLGEVRGITPASDQENSSSGEIKGVRNRKWAVQAFLWGLLGVKLREQPEENSTNRPQTIRKNPTSQFSFDMRRLERKLELVTETESVRVIGVVPASVRFLTSEVSCNLAYLYAAKGKRVLLVDANVYSTPLTRTLAAKAEKGLADVLLGSAEAKDCIIRNAISDVDLLPARVVEGPVFTTWPFPPKLLREKLEDIQESYDVIIVDLPHACSPAALSINSILEAVVIMADYGCTKIAYLAELAATYQSNAREFVGAAIATKS